MDYEQSINTSFENANRIKPKISDIVRKHQVYFVHGIHPNFSPGGNTLLNPKVDWQHKLDIVIAFQPTISSSTIRKGEKEENLWSRIGVVLSEGTVEAAYSKDAATVAINIFKRDTQLSVKKSSIEQAINKSGPTGGISGLQYNELEVSGPSIGGFYINLDEPDRISNYDIGDFQKIVAKLKKRKIPLYVMLEGQLYESSVGNISVKELDTIKKNAEKKGEGETADKLLVGKWKIVSPEEILDRSLNLSVD